MHCPRCGTEMNGPALANGMVWNCASCQGTSIGTSLLQNVAKVDFVPALWSQFRTEGLPKEKKCPACKKPMHTLPTAIEGQRAELDACLTCMLRWFDRGELEQVKLKAKEFWPGDKIDYDAYRYVWSRPISYQQRCMHLLSMFFSSI